MITKKMLKKIDEIPWYQRGEYSTAGQLHRTDGRAIGDWLNELIYTGFLEGYFRESDNSEPQLELIKDYQLWLRPNGQLHHPTQPALILPNGKVFHFLNGKIHRDEKVGPAVISPDGSFEYYHHGQLHRVRGPARVSASGDVSYYQHNQLHRTDGPAFIENDGSLFYYQHNKLSRKDGPAVIRQSLDLEDEQEGRALVEWWFQGVRFANQTGLDLVL